MLDAIRQELAALERFTEVLHHEQSALVNTDVEALTALSREKLKLADELNALASHRLAYLKASGLSADAAGMEAWLSDKPAASRQHWRALIEKARAAKNLNQTNGKLLQTRLKHNQQALNALMNAADQAGTYGPDGQSRSTLPGSGRTIGKG